MSSFPTTYCFDNQSNDKDGHFSIMKSLVSKRGSGIGYMLGCLQTFPSEQLTAKLHLV